MATRPSCPTACVSATPSGVSSAVGHPCSLTGLDAALYPRRVYTGWCRPRRYNTPLSFARLPAPAGKTAVGQRHTGANLRLVRPAGAAGPARWLGSFSKNTTRLLCKLRGDLRCSTGRKKWSAANFLRSRGQGVIYRAVGSTGLKPGETATAATLFACDLGVRAFRPQAGRRIKLGWPKLACQWPFVISFPPTVASGKGPSFGAARRYPHRQTG